MSGIHLVCEGADGTGKSSVVKIINDYLSDMGYNTTCHGNPGGTPLGKELRTLIKNRPDLNIDDRTIQILMMADWHAYLHSVVVPGVKDGKIVISDRANVISGICYSIASGLDISQINDIMKCIPIDSPKIHLVVLFAGFDELRNRQHHDIAPDGQIIECRFQKKGEKYHRDVIDAYQLIIKSRNPTIGSWLPIETLLFRFIHYTCLSGFSIWPVDVTMDLQTIKQHVVKTVDSIIHCSKLIYKPPEWICADGEIKRHIKTV